MESSTSVNRYKTPEKRKNDDYEKKLLDQKRNYIEAKKNRLNNENAFNYDNINHNN